MASRSRIGMMMCDGANPSTCKLSHLVHVCDHLADSLGSVSVKFESLKLSTT